MHEEIDRLTAQVYGWSAELSEAEIVVALAALNRVRSVEEGRGRVRWLRPGYQANRAAGARSVSPDDLEGLAPGLPDPSARRAFPSDRYEQPLALQAAVAHAGGPVRPADLARRFTGGARLTPRIDRVLTTLHRYGHVERLSDGRWISARL